MKSELSSFVIDFLGQSAKNAVVMRFLNDKNINVYEISSEQCDLLNKQLDKVICHFQEMSPSQKLNLIIDYQQSDFDLFCSAIQKNFLLRKNKKQILQHLQTLDQDDAIDFPELVVKLLFDPDINIQKQKQNLQKEKQNIIVKNVQLKEQIKGSFELMESQKQRLISTIIQKQRINGLQSLNKQQLQTLYQNTSSELMLRKIQRFKKEMLKDAQMHVIDVQVQSESQIGIQLQDDIKDLISQNFENQKKIKQDKYKQKSTLKSIHRSNISRVKRQRQRRQIQKMQNKWGQKYKSLVYSPQYQRYLMKPRLHTRQVYNQVRRQFKLSRRLKIYPILRKQFAKFRKEHLPNCAFCQLSISSQNMTRHYQRIHLRQTQKQLFKIMHQRKNACPWCLQQFKLASLKQSHMKMCLRASNAKQFIQKKVQWYEGPQNQVQFQLKPQQSALMNEVMWKSPLIGHQKRQQIVFQILQKLYDSEIPQFQGKFGMKKVFNPIKDLKKLFD